MKRALLSIQKFISAKKLTLSEEERKTLVAPIDNEVTAVDIDRITNFVDFLNNNQANYRSLSANTPGYFVFSTAPFNTDDGEADVVVDRTPALKASVLDQFIPILKSISRDKGVEDTGWRRGLQGAEQVRHTAPRLVADSQM